MTRHARTLAPLLLSALALLAPALTRAQRPAASAAPTLTIDVGSETENFLRYLQSLGGAPRSQWSIRSFAPPEVDSLLSRGDAAASLRSFEHPVHAAGRLRWQAEPVAGASWYNTGFPFGENDGAVWSGRGLTAAVQGGVALRYGVLSVNVEPIAFWAQNRDFQLMPNGQVGALRYGDALLPKNIDRPQRFGAGAYARLDPGQSTIRVDAFGVAAGLSTANQWWGPMSEWPFLLSDNAAGFPHAFAGTSTPWNVGIGRFQARVMYGRLEQSAYTDITGAAQHRFISGIVGSFMPRGIDGLEIGAARLFEEVWPAGGLGWRELRKPFEGFLKASLPGGTGTPVGPSDNQLASVFARWTFAPSGLEVYSEFGRDDHNRDTRDLLEEPDHDATLGLGMRKAWRRADGQITGLRAELFDLDPSILGRNRGEGFKYTHTQVRQGHTERGQVLGAGFAAINGTGGMIAYERYAANDEKLLLSLSRMVVRERAATATVPGSLDVQYALAAERTRRLGKVGITYGLTGVYEMNRYFAADAGNLLGTIRVGR
jgi:hypothetical protein